MRISGSHKLCLIFSLCPALVQGLAIQPNQHKILVLGGTGFLGQEVVKQLDDLGISYVAPSRQELDLTAPDARDKVTELCRESECNAVVTCVGSLLGNEQDRAINAANEFAAKGAQESGCVQRFVSIGNDPKVRAFSKTVPALKHYAQGKEESEKMIRGCFPDSYTIVCPTVLHGGEDFSLNPPRIPGTLGGVAESVLGLYPFQSASEALPSVLGLALQAPMSKEVVAKVCLNAALGLPQCGGDLDTRDAILTAAAKRPQKMALPEAKDDAQGLKQELYAMGDCQGDPARLEEAFELLGKIEGCNERQPATDPSLNGRWDFVLDIEADLGTGLLKDVLYGDNAPLGGMVFDLKDLYMEVQDNSKVTIHVDTTVLGQAVELKLTTTLIPDDLDPSGTTFLEQFEGIGLMGRSVPLPKDWQRARPLEFSYLDDNMLIARGNGEKPHYLKRD